MTLFDLNCVIIVVAIFLFVILIISSIFAWRLEKTVWNKGICKDTGKPWKLFTVDNKGCRLYKDGNGHFCDMVFKIEGEQNCSKGCAHSE